MIRRLHIKNYKSMRNTEVFFEPLTVVFGPNASGKSNLFDALHLISRMVSERSLKEAFSRHRGMPLETVHVPAKEVHDSSKGIRMTFEVDVQLSPETIKSVECRIHMLRKGLEENDDHSKSKIITNPTLRYRIELEVIEETGETRVYDERLVAIRQDGKGEKARGAFIERTEDNKGHPKLSLRMEGQARPTLYDIGLNHTVVSSELYAPHYPHITAFREELKNCHIYYFEPRELMRSASSIADINRPGSHGEDLPAFYNTLENRQASQFKNLKMTAKSILPRLDDITIKKGDNGELYLMAHEEGTPFSNRMVSEGTLRVLGLVAVMSPSTGSTTIGYEEPENGVHPRRLNQIAELLKNAHNENRQILINTHSPSLPGYFQNKYLMVCLREEGQTVFKPFSSLGPLYKNNEIADHLDERIERGDFGG